MFAHHQCGKLTIAQFVMKVYTTVSLNSHYLKCYSFMQTRVVQAKWLIPHQFTFMCTLTKYEMLNHVLSGNMHCAYNWSDFLAVSEVGILQECSVKFNQIVLFPNIKLSLTNSMWIWTTSPKLTDDLGFRNLDLLKYYGFRTWTLSSQGIVEYLL